MKSTSDTTTFAPVFANATAVARPIPLPPPVITTSSRGGVESVTNSLIIRASGAGWLRGAQCPAAIFLRVSDGTQRSRSSGSVRMYRSRVGWITCTGMGARRCRGARMTCRMLARYNEIPRTASDVIVREGLTCTPSSRCSTPPQRGPRYSRQNSGASTGRWNAPMYQDRKNCLM